MLIIENTENAEKQKEGNQFTSNPSYQETIAFDQFGAFSPDQ